MFQYTGSDKHCTTGLSTGTNSVLYSKFSNPFLFASDLTTLPVNKRYVQVQLHLDSLDTWVSKNKMRLAMHK